MGPEPIPSCQEKGLLRLSGRMERPSSPHDDGQAGGEPPLPPDLGEGVVSLPPTFWGLQKKANQPISINRALRPAHPPTLPAAQLEAALAPTDGSCGRLKGRAQSPADISFLFLWWGEEGAGAEGHSDTAGPPPGPSLPHLRGFSSVSLSPRPAAPAGGAAGSPRRPPPAGRTPPVAGHPRSAGGRGGPGRPPLPPQVPAQRPRTDSAARESRAQDFGPTRRPPWTPKLQEGKSAGSGARPGESAPPSPPNLAAPRHLGAPALPATVWGCSDLSGCVQAPDAPSSGSSRATRNLARSPVLLPCPRATAPRPSPPLPQRAPGPRGPPASRTLTPGRRVLIRSTFLP